MVEGSSDRCNIIRRFRRVRIVSGCRSEVAHEERVVAGGTRSRRWMGSTELVSHGKETARAAACEDVDRRRWRRVGEGEDENRGMGKKKGKARIGMSWPMPLSLSFFFD